MPRTYEHLSLDERRKLDRWFAGEIRVTVIAQRLRRARSTIYRELKRNHFSDQSMPKVVGYFALAAHKMAENRRVSDTKFLRHTSLRHHIVKKIKDSWTPE